MKCFCDEIQFSILFFVPLKQKQAGLFFLLNRTAFAAPGILHPNHSFPPPTTHTVCNALIFRKF